MLLVEYFAYGSNLLPARLLRRVPSARAIGPAVLSGYRLSFHKRGADQSGKCNAFYTGDMRDYVIGVIYELSETDRPVLDRVEGPGYATVGINVTMGDGTLSAFAYVARPTHIEHDLVPFDWYRDFVLAGARHHGLDEAYIGRIEAIHAQSDPDTVRSEENRAILRDAVLPTGEVKR